MKDLFCQNVKRLRKQKEMSQEQLAQALDITMQAVSKWECGLSYPDIETLLLLSDLLDVTVDELLRDSTATAPIPHTSLKLPDDNTFRIIQCVGNHIIQKEEFQKEELCHPSIHSIPISLENSNNAIHGNVEIWGNAEIDGDIQGNINAGNSITCGDVGGNASAGDSITCSDIGGNANAGDSITCSDIGGNVNAGDNITCCDVGGDANAGDSINCGDVGGDISAGEGITCGDVGGDVSAGDSISCETIQGDVCSCEGDIHCNSIEGSISAEGGVYLQNS